LARGGTRAFVALRQALGRNSPSLRLLRRIFRRRQGLQTERVNLSSQILGQSSIYQALAGDAIQAFEALGYHKHGKMTLAPFTRALMSTMFGAIVVNLQLLRSEGLIELRSQAIGYGSHNMASLYSYTRFAIF
jgi:hypothetical protein